MSIFSFVKRTYTADGEKVVVSNPKARFIQKYFKIKSIVHFAYAVMDIIFGIEEVVVAALEILCYGVTPEMLFAHPELASAGPEEWYKVMHSYGVLCIQAHPFRERDYIPKARMLPFDCIDGIEVYNNSFGE